MLRRSAPPDAMGRPSTLNMGIVAKVCDELAKGRALKAICRDEGMPDESTFRTWERAHAEVAALSAHARELGCHALADECLDIADDARNDWMVANHGDDAGWRANGDTVQRSRLRIDTRMRLLGKWLPKVYGDKLDLNHSGSVNIGRELAALNALAKPGAAPD